MSKRAKSYDKIVVKPQDITVTFEVKDGSRVIGKMTRVFRNCKIRKCSSLWKEVCFTYEEVLDC